MIKSFSILVFYCATLSAYTPADVAYLKADIGYFRYGITGWCSENKAMEIVDLILEVKPRVYVEIGVFEGASFFPAVATLKFLGQGTAIGIDPWDYYECIRYFDRNIDEHHWRWWASVDFEKTMRNFQKWMNASELGHYCKILRKPSVEAASQIGEIDILHIDGDHSETMSLKDVQLYLPKVRPQGYIWLNDALWKERGDAVDLLLECCDVVKVIESGNCLLFKKR